MRFSPRAVLDRLARVEIAPLLGLLLPAALLSMTFAIMDEVAEGDADAIDRMVLAALRAPGAPHQPIGPAWLEIAMKDVTSLGSTTVLTLVVAAAVGFLLISRRYGLAVILSASMIAGTIANDILKNVFERARPEFIADGVPIHSFSFPSGHAMLSAMIYLSLGALLARSEKRVAHKRYIIGLSIVLTLLIGVSRIYLGVHYPSDVMAGWSIGAVWAIATWWLARRAPSRGD